MERRAARPTYILHTKPALAACLPSSPTYVRRFEGPAADPASSEGNYSLRDWLRNGVPEQTLQLGLAWQFGSCPARPVRRLRRKGMKKERGGEEYIQRPAEG